MLKRLIFSAIILALLLGACSCSILGSFGNDDHKHVDDDADGICDSCAAPCADACEHTDADDNGSCDMCAEEYSDGCDRHVDADDNGACDVCAAAYTDGCDNHRDRDDDGSCDFCATLYTDGEEHILEGKKMIFIGNSYTYYGQTVLEKDQKYLEQSTRTGDKGYFYQLCKSEGAEVEVTNWTFGGHSLDHLFGGSCYASRGCDGVDHKAYLVDKSFDYVVIQQGSGQTSSDRFLTDITYVMDFFREANPDVKFVVLVPYSAYGVYGSTPTLAVNMLNNLKTVATMGATVVDWGGVVMDIIEGRAEIPDSTIDYVKNSFVISKSAKDGYHPNQLSGYITTLMTYAAITGESAVGKAYDFCNDPSLDPSGSFISKFFSFDVFIAMYYTYDGATTNYRDVFKSEKDMAGIQAIIDAHLAAKAYLTYNYSDGITDSPPDSGADASSLDS